MNKSWLSPGQYVIDRFLHAALVVLLAWSVVSVVACGDSGRDTAEGEEVVARISQAQTIATGTDVGTLAGRFSVAPSGVGSYLVPLWTPAGRNGLSPQISLTYSSAAGDSPAGHGWSIQGGSSMIYRCLENSLRFEKPHQVDFESDSYCLDGVALVLINGTPGTVGAEYRTEPDSITKIVVTAADASTPPVPLVFDVFTQDGLKHTYGSTSDPTLVIEGEREIWEAPSGGPDARSDAVITTATGRPPERYGWLKGTTTDRFSNAIRFRYSHPASARDVGGAQEPLLSSIEYVDVAATPTRQIKLTYVPRPDPLTNRKSYVAGLLFQSTKLLSSIDVLVTSPGAGLPTSVRFYSLTHESSPTTARPLLTQVQECDGNPSVSGRACKLPTVLTYEPGRLDFQEVSTGITDVRQAIDSAFWTIETADMNHDGRDDIVYHAAVPGSDFTRHWFMRLSLGDGFSPPIDMHLQNNFVEKELVLADLDDDGFPDVQAFEGGRYVSYKNNRDNTFTKFPGAAIDPATAAGRAAAIGDFSGKGQISALRSLSDGSWGQRFVANGAMTELSGDMGCLLGSTDDGFNAYVVDFDDDGSANFITIDENNAGERLGVLKQVTVPAPIPKLGVSPPDLIFDYQQTTILRSRRNDQAKYFFLDQNGDGLPDALRVRAGEAVPALAINTGAGFSRPTPQVSLQGGPGNIRVGIDAAAVDLVDPGIRVLDFDGDGRQDILLVDDGHARAATNVGTATRTALTVLLSRGDGYEVRSLPIPIGLPAALTDAGGPSARPEVNNYKQSQVLDVNGDGLPDIVQISAADNTVHLFIHQGKKADMLVGIENGMGKKTSVVNEPMTNADVYVPGGSCTLPQQCMVRGPWLVASYETDNGANGKNQYVYLYDDNRIDVRGGGVLGMRRWTIVDKARLTTVETTYDDTSVADVTPLSGSAGQVYSKLGMPVQRVVETPTDQPGGLRTQTQTFDYDFIATNNAKSYYTRPIRTITTEVEDGIQLAQRIETFTYDPNGDLGLSTGSQVTRTNAQGNFVDIMTLTLVSDVGQWVLGLPSKLVQISRATPAGLPAEDVSRTVTFTPNLGQGVEDAVVLEGGNDEFLRTDFTRNGFGQTTTVKRTDKAGNVRQETTTYDAQNVHQATFTNAVGHVTALQVDPALGVLQSLTDANLAVTSYNYDRFARLRRVSRAGGGGKTITYARDIEPGSLPPDHRFVTRTVTTFDGGGEVRTLTNRLDQQIRREERNLDGSLSFVNQSFDELGMPSSLTRPAKVGASPGSSTTWTYDRLSRLRQRVRPEEAVDGSEMPVTTGTRTYDYAGLDTTLIDEFGRSSGSKEDGFGRVVRTNTTDDAGHPVPTEFTYGAFDLLRLVKRFDSTATQSRTTEMAYDFLGRRKTLIDPNTGQRSYRYNGFGEVREETDASGVVTTYQRDAVGRVIKRTDKDGITTFTWDTALHGKGHLAQSTSASGVKCDYFYDAFGRRNKEITTIDGTSYQVDYVFDANGRVQKTRYPNVPGFSRLVVANVYDAGSGLLAKVTNDANGKLFWQLKTTEVDGQIRQESFGNNVVSDYTHSAATGRLGTIKSSLLTSTLRSDSFAYWVDGNLRRRSDLVAKNNERFEYDSQDRLRRWLDADANGRPLSGGWSVNYTIDDFENLTRRNFVAGSATGGTSQDATFQLVPGTDRIAGGFLGSYGYDANGNQTGRPGGETVAYTAFDLPKTMTGPQPATFAYDARGIRAKKARSSTDFTIYVGGLFERRRSGAAIDDIFYVLAGGRVVAQVTRREGGTESLLFLHRDRQGSVDLVTDGSGSVAEKTRRDPFGNKVTNFNQPVLPTVIAASSNRVRLGYNGQEQDDELGLINMKGRMYDPRVGRFITPDPVVQSVFSGQDHNRYAYVFNNPTRYLDRSGFDGETPDCELWGYTCTPPEPANVAGSHWEWNGTDWIKIIDVLSPVNDVTVTQPPAPPQPSFSNPFTGGEGVSVGSTAGQPSTGVGGQTTNDSNGNGTGDKKGDSPPPPASTGDKPPVVAVAATTTTLPLLVRSAKVARAATAVAIFTPATLTGVAVGLVVSLFSRSTVSAAQEQADYEAALRSTRVIDEAVPERDISGKVHSPEGTVLPDYVPGHWSDEDLIQASHELGESIARRREEQEQLGEEGRHRERIRQEEKLKQAVDKAIEEKGLEGEQ